MRSDLTAKRSRAVEVPPPDRSALPIDGHVRRAARAALTILLVALACWVARGFLCPLAWAALIAVAAWPAYRRFAAFISRHPSRLVAPLLFTMAAGAVLIVPVVVMVNQIAQGSDALMQWLTGLGQSGMPVPSWLVRLPIVSDYLVEWWQANFSDPKATLAWLRHVNVESVTAWTSTLGGELLYRLAAFLLTLVALFFMLRDGDLIAERVVATVDRLLGDPGDDLALKVADAVRGTVKGTVVIAVVQGVLIGIAYVAAGVPNPLLFVLLTIVFGMLPFGAWAVFTGAAVVLLAQGGSVLAAALVFGFGAAVMLAATLVWPALVGGTAQLPFLVALMGIFGGLQTFGLIGLFLGPVIMAALLTTWREWLVPPAPSVPPADAAR